MTGQHLVLCDGPGGDARAFRSAYARYLANCCRRFLTLGAELPAPLRGLGNNREQLRIAARSGAQHRLEDLREHAASALGYPADWCHTADEAKQIRKAVLNSKLHNSKSMKTEQ